MFTHFHASLSFDESKLSAICRKWKIAERSLFGSALRDDFGPDSDVDLVVWIVNPIRRKNILSSLQVVYAAG